MLKQRTCIRRIYIKCRYYNCCLNFTHIRNILWFSNCKSGAYELYHGWLLPVCILRCCCKWQSCLNPLSQKEQMCLRIPVCTRLCCANCCLLLKPLLQLGQRCVRSGCMVELTSTKFWSLEVSWESSGFISVLSVGWGRLKSDRIYHSQLKEWLYPWWKSSEIHIIFMGIFLLTKKTKQIHKYHCKVQKRNKIDIEKSHFSHTYKVPVHVDVL